MAISALGAGLVARPLMVYEGMESSTILSAQVCCSVNYSHVAALQFTHSYERPEGPSIHIRAPHIWYATIV